MITLREFQRHAHMVALRWWTAHWLIQLLISGPVIYAGWSFGHQTALMLDMGPFVDTHQKTGLALLILYVAQLLLGIFIHFFKFPSIFRGRRPPQNYLHVFLGAAIFILAAFQVHLIISMYPNSNSLYKKIRLTTGYILSGSFSEDCIIFRKQPRTLG